MEKQTLATLEEFNVASTKADEEVVIVHDMDDYATNTWKTLPPVGLVFPARDLAGSNCGGVAVVGGPNGDRIEDISGFNDAGGRSSAAALTTERSTT